MKVAAKMVLSVFLAALLHFAPTALAQTHFPADKYQVAASTLEVMQTQVGPGAGTSGPVTLFSTSFRTSTPADLLIYVSAECALWTDIVSPASEAEAKVTMWLELDGKRVPVTSDANGDGVHNDPDDGEVVFCNRAFRISAPAQPPQAIELFQRTRSANDFNWGTLNVGNGIHTLELKAQLDASVLGTGTFAQAAVGKRTMIIEPVHLANDAQI